MQPWSLIDDSAIDLDCDQSLCWSHLQRDCCKPEILPYCSAHVKCWLLPPAWVSTAELMVWRHWRAIVASHLLFNLSNLIRLFNRLIFIRRLIFIWDIHRSDLLLIEVFCCYVHLWCSTQVDIQQHTNPEGKLEFTSCTDFSKKLSLFDHCKDG